MPHSVSPLLANLVMVQHHLELVEVVPLGGLAGAEVVEVVPGREPERVELPAGVEEEDRRRLLVAHPRIVALPLAHDLHVVGVASEAVKTTDAVELVVIQTQPVIIYQV